MGDERIGRFRVDNGLIASLLTSPSKQVWIDYDAEVDVLYISFRRPQQADDSVEEEEDVIYHYSGDQLVGVTILNAHARL